MSPTPELPSPPTAARRWAGALLALAVTVPLSLAPLLGNWDIPGFKALLSLYPSSLRETALPLAALAMALVAISVQFFSRDTFSGRRLRKWFVSLLASLFALLLLLAYVHSQHVVRVYYRGGTLSESYIVGSQRGAHCPCDSGDSDAICISYLGLNPDYHQKCWPQRDVRQIGFLLELLYILLMAGTGALVGLLVMVRTQRRKKPASKAR